MPLTSHRASLPHRASLVALIEEEVVCADLGALMTAGTKAATASEVVTSGTSLPVESSAAGVVLESDVPQPPQVSGLAGLLRICGQDSEAGLPTMQALLAGLADLRRITKVGEGSFGEAYKHNKCVCGVWGLCACHVIVCLHIETHRKLLSAARPMVSPFTNAAKS
jgi:hypothetical protein